MNEQDDKPQKATTETLDSFAERVRRHTNDCHQDELRRYVRGRTGADIAGVELAELTAAGATFWWVDPTGAHTGQIHFAQRAADITELAVALRVELGAD
ncbi:MAG: hypothetical protein JWO63_22 [Frankiales bacterium]|nr:hypothetical protein [Frankiales bacterium]